MSQYAEMIKEARKQETPEPDSPAKSRAETETPQEVNLSIKVSKELRRHWACEAKRQDTSLTAAIIKAMKERFGEPG